MAPIIKAAALAIWWFPVVLSTPSAVPIPAPTAVPLPVPTAVPIPAPTAVPMPTAVPILAPTAAPIPAPTSAAPSASARPTATALPTALPSVAVVAVSDDAFASGGEGVSLAPTSNATEYCDVWGCGDQAGHGTQDLVIGLVAIFMMIATFAGSVYATKKEVGPKTESFLRFLVIFLYVLPGLSLFFTCIFAALISAVEGIEFHAAFWMALAEFCLSPPLIDQEEPDTREAKAVSLLIATTSLGVIGILVGVVAGPILDPFLETLGLMPHNVCQFFGKFVLFMFITFPLLSVGISSILAWALAAAEGHAWEDAFWVVLAEVTDCEIIADPDDIDIPRTFWGKLITVLVGLWAIALFGVWLAIIAVPLLGIQLNFVDSKILQACGMLNSEQIAFVKRKDRQEAQDELNRLGEDGTSRLRRLFRQIDSNESGDIDQAEMSELIHTCTGHKPTDAEAAAMLAKADANGDGRIDFEEFVLLHAHIRNGTVDFKEFTQTLDEFNELLDNLEQGVESKEGDVALAERTR